MILFLDFSLTGDEVPVGVIFGNESDKVFDKRLFLKHRVVQCRHDFPLSNENFLPALIILFVADVIMEAFAREGQLYLDVREDVFILLYIFFSIAEEPLFGRGYGKYLYGYVHPILLIRAGHYGDAGFLKFRIEEVFFVTGLLINPLTNAFA